MRFSQESRRKGQYSLGVFKASLGHGEYFHSQFDGDDENLGSGYLDMIRNNVAFDMPGNSDNMACVDEDFLVILGYMIEEGLDLVFEAATKAPGSAGASGGWGFAIDNDSVMRQVDDDILANSVTKDFFENDELENNPNGNNPTLQNPNTLILRVPEVIFATYGRENIENAVAAARQGQGDPFKKIARYGREKFGAMPLFRIIRHPETGHQIGIVILETKLAHIQYGKGVRSETVRVGSAIDAFNGQIPYDRAQFIPLKELDNYEEDFLQIPRVRVVEKVMANRLVPEYSAELIEELRNEQAGSTGAARSPADLEKHKKHTETILAQLDDGELPAAYPYQAQIDLTNFCNFKVDPQFKDCMNCVFPKNTPEYIPFENLRMFLDSFSKHGGRSIFLTGGGEPGTYKDLPQLFEYMAKSNLQLTLNTNGFFVRRMAVTDPEILRAVFSKEKGPSFVSFSVHCDDCYADMLRLSQLKKGLGLDIISRATYLIHPDTTKEEIHRAVERCVQSGADILDFKPAHMATEKGREFLPNQQAYDEIKELTKRSENGELAMKITALRLNRLKADYREARTMSDICLAPVTTIFINALMQAAICCDTKWFGLGGSGCELAANGFPMNLQNYYIDAMWGIIKLNFHNCLLGCNFEEINIEKSGTLTFLVSILREMRQRYLQEHLSEEQVKENLWKIFKKGDIGPGENVTPAEPKPDLGETENPLLRRYEDVREEFKKVAVYPGPEMAKRMQLDKAYEALENGTRLPGRTDSFVTSFDLPKGELTSVLNHSVDDIISVLPERAVYHKIDPSSYHVSVIQIQDLPFDTEENRLTTEEWKAAEEAVARVIAETTPYQVKFLGLRFGIDGGVIAVFEDEGLRTQALRDVLTDECNKVCNNKVSRSRKKPLVSITLMRIFSNIEGADLTRLKAKAEGLKDLSNLGLTMDLKSLTFYHETRFMHSAFDYSRSYELGKKNENVIPDEASASKLFEIVESSLNNERTKFIETGNKLIDTLTAPNHTLNDMVASAGLSLDKGSGFALSLPKGSVSTLSSSRRVDSLPAESGSETAADTGTLDKKMATAEIRQRIERAIAAIESSDKEGITPEAKVAMELLKKNLNQFEADGGAASIIILARKAKRENQKLIIGLETDWIPAINKEGSLQRNAISALMKEIYSIGEALQSMGLDNVEIIRGSGSRLADSLMKASKDSNTDMRNIVVMASKDTIISDSFKVFRDAGVKDRPFLTGIDPVELIKLYEEFGELVSKQLHIKLTTLLYMTLEAAAGKEPPKAPWIQYDSVKRILILVPRAEPKDYEDLKNAYKAEAAALQSA